MPFFNYCLFWESILLLDPKTNWKTLKKVRNWSPQKWGGAVKDKFINEKSSAGANEKHALGSLCRRLLLPTIPYIIFLGVGYW